MKKLILVLVTLIFLLILALLYARFIEPQRLVVRHIEVRSPKLPPDFSGLRLIHLSDLHISSMSQKLQRRVIKAARKTKPDVIIITGDLVSNSVLFEAPLHPQLMQETASIIAFLDSLPTTRGIYIVRGNHDIGNDKEVSDLLVNALRGRGHKVLINQKEVLDIDGVSIHLLGIDYSVQDSTIHVPFKMVQDKDDIFLQSGPSQKNSYCNYYYHDADERWQNYTVSARFRLSNVNHSGIGMVFYSQLHKGLDHYYRLRWSASETYFRLSPHNTSLTSGEETLPMAMQPNQWYWAKARVTTFPQHTQIMAKAWPATEKEPEHWQTVAYDSSCTRLMGGSIGLWSIYDGLHEFDDVRVVADNGDTLLCEDWQVNDPPHKPLGWIDFRHNQRALPYLLQGIPDSSYTLLMTHTFEMAEAANAYGIDLMLCGHTHGGQVRLPLIGTPLRIFDRRYEYSAGLYPLSRTILYLNRGMGTILFPIRFMSPPEVVVIELLGSNKDSPTHFMPPDLTSVKRNYH